MNFVFPISQFDGMSGKDNKERDSKKFEIENEKEIRYGSSGESVKLDIQELNFFYGDKHVLKNINLKIFERCVTAIIGPSGCGKTTLLRCFNRMHDLYPEARYSGKIILYPDNVNIMGKGVDPVKIRMRIGMVFQRPNPFPKSIYENVAYGLRIKGIRKNSLVDEKVEIALRQAALWDEVKDRLKDNAYTLSGGQQQRLCIARAIAQEPDVLLFDEPTSALDPISTAKIEELINQLKNSITIIIVTHSPHQAARVSDYTLFMYFGEVIEYDRTQKIFVNPSHELTEKYISGAFG